MIILIFIATFFFMEFVAWFTHKFIMHGLLWKLHADQHVPSHQSFFEKNDYFFLVFATPGIAFIVLGSFLEISQFSAIGFGITAYGMCYFLVHDIFIHQRFKWFRNSNNLYFRAIRRTHKVHHKKLGKHDGECFGMLLVPLQYFRAEINSRAVGKQQRSQPNTKSKG